MRLSLILDGQYHWQKNFTKKKDSSYNILTSSERKPNLIANVGVTEIVNKVGTDFSKENAIPQEEQFLLKSLIEP